MTYNWNKFKRKIYIQSSLESLFDGWTKSGEIVKWFIKTCEYRDSIGNLRQGDERCQLGDTYYWKWHQDLETSGKILEVVENKRFAFTFGMKEKDSDEYVIVSVDFGKMNGEGYYYLTQENMGGPDLEKAHYHLSCNAGWSFFMTNMKAVYEHGVDLREFDETRAYETRSLSIE